MVSLVGAWEDVLTSLRDLIDALRWEKDVLVQFSAILSTPLAAFNWDLKATIRDELNRDELWDVV